MRHATTGLHHRLLVLGVTGAVGVATLAGGGLVASAELPGHGRRLSPFGRR